MDNYNQEFTNYTVIDSQPASGAIAKKFMANVFMWMFVALGISTFFSVLLLQPLHCLSIYMFKQKKDGNPLG